MKKQRKHYTPEEKVAILRRHLLEKEPISKLCDELGLQPTVFYRWQKRRLLGSNTAPRVTETLGRRPASLVLPPHSGPRSRARPGRRRGSPCAGSRCGCSRPSRSP